MATRTIRCTYSLSGSDSDKQMSNAPLSPPSGIKWTLVEGRPSMSGAGAIKLKFDTEQYHEFSQNVTDQCPNQRTFSLDVVAPHSVDVRATDESGASNTAEIEITIEESPLGAK